MKVTEIFYSLQGEGSLLGTPSVFVRTSGCNLRCSWCDTPYTSWRPEGKDMTVDKVIQEVSQYGASHIVITGGEPMITPEVVDLTQRAHALNMHVTIETAGTVFKPVTCDLMSISPKLSNSTPEGPFQAQHERLRIQPSILRELMDRYEYQLKFVVSSRQDVGELQDLLAELRADKKKVILMPEGIDAAELHARSIWLAEVCKETGFRYSPRLHVDIWGNRRGI